MLTILFSVLVGYLLSLAGFDSLIGLEGTTYYLSFAIFGAVCFIIDKLKG